MKVLLTGGTGFIGRPLKNQLISLGHEVFVLTRIQRTNVENLHYIQWSWKSPEDLTELVNQVDVVINLAGEPVVGKRWTKEQKEILLKSRIKPTEALINAINSATKKPKKFISASAVGIYGNRFDEKLTEESSLGSDFLANLCKEWEACALKANTNVAIIRIGIVIGKEGGALKRMLPLFKMGLGGPLGTGKQWMPWISLRDTVDLIRFIIDYDNVTGIINAASPNPVTNEKFSKTLGKVLHRPVFLPAPDFALRLMLGEIADLILGGQRVIPERALQYGYNFKHEELGDALVRAV